VDEKKNPRILRRGVLEITQAGGFGDIGPDMSIGLLKDDWV